MNESNQTKSKILYIFSVSYTSYNILFMFNTSKEREYEVGVSGEYNSGEEKGHKSKKTSKEKKKKEKSSKDKKKRKVK